MKTFWRDGERVRTVELQRLAPGRWRARVDDHAFDVSAEVLLDGRLELSTDDGRGTAEVTAAGDRRFVRLGTFDYVLHREKAGRARDRGAVGGLEAPMPGVVTRVMVRPGDEVTRGTPLVALEAMKMEHLIRAPRDGRVKALPVAAGTMVQAGTPLAELDAEG